MNLQICDNKLSTHNIPKSYLDKKNFSYKLYINMCHISFWKYFKEVDDTQQRVEYQLQFYNISKLEDLIGLSKSTIRNKFKQRPYRIRNNYYEIDKEGKLLEEYENTQTKFLYFNSPKSNYIKISLNELEVIKELSEMEIRLFIFLKSFSSNEIIGQTQKKILESIGYSPNSKSNEKILRDATNKLKELELIETKLFSDGIKKYIIYYKNK